MRVEALIVERSASWSSKPNQLVGTLTLIDADGAKLEIPLTPAAISRLITSVSSEVIDTLRQVTNNAPRALQQAQDEGYLLESDGEIKV